MSADSVTGKLCPHCTGLISQLLPHHSLQSVALDKRITSSSSDSEEEANKNIVTSNVEQRRCATLVDTSPAVTEYGFLVKTGAVWWLPLALHRQFQAAYGRLDLDAAYMNAQTWCIANPRKRKSSEGMPKFLNSWLSREAARLPKVAATVDHPLAQYQTIVPKPRKNVTPLPQE